MRMNLEAHDMSDYEFVLKYRLPGDLRGETAVEALGAGGCTDALAGIGLAGRLAVEFDRAGESAWDVIRSAISDVERALPEADLIEVCPDLVGLTEIADFVGTSRQNIRKLLVGAEGSPLPAHDGSTTLWHLVEVLDWLVERKGYPSQPVLRETALAARSINLDSHHTRHLQQKLTPSRIVSA